MAEVPDELELACSQHPSLVAAGWERRFVVDLGRALEAIVLYLSLGFEVCAVPLTPTGLGSQCRDCQLVACRTCVTVYTRRP
jgi:hypothetical protein